MLLKEPLAPEKVMQGVTTELLGQDGIAVAPVRPEHKDGWRRHLSGLLGDPGFEWDWTEYDGYFQRLEEARPSVNALSLAPHGTLRQWVMGMEDRVPTSSELREMAALMDEQMEAGCVGLSTGLIYPPCIYAEREEMIALCSVAAKYGGFFVVHMRSEGYCIEEALSEVIAIAGKAGVPLHISHLKVAGRENFGKSKRILEMIDEAREGGMDLTFDQYPYLAGCTMLQAILPSWTFKGGPDKLLERLNNSRTATG
jgi:N-acyl-D-amino-acid deacylase